MTGGGPAVSQYVGCPGRRPKGQGDRGRSRCRMTDPTRRPEHAAYREQEPAPDPEVLQLAAKIFNLSRQGGTDVLATYVDPGVPANLCNDKADTLVTLAAYHGHPQ